MVLTRRRGGRTFASIGFFRDIRVPEPARAERLVSEGMLGWARIESVHETGLADGDDAVLMLDLSVQVPGRERYRTSHTQVVARRELSGLRAGARVPVRVHPEDPHDLLIS